MTFLFGLLLAVLTSQEKLGKEIYTRGTDAKVTLGDSDMPGRLFPCSNCHGADGRGKPEGGVVPSDVRWETLSKPYGATHASGRRHGAYDEALTAIAIRSGVDAAGNRLNPAMPRYDLSDAEMESLIAYLKRVGDDRDPGLDEDTITVGTHAAAQPVLEAFFREVNQRGGVYSRRILVRAETGENVFAVLAPASAIEGEAPVIGPLTSGVQGRHVFRLLPGSQEEAAALAWFACTTSGSPLVLYPESIGGELVQRVVDGVRRAGCGGVRTASWKPSAFNAATLVRGECPRGVVFLGSAAELEALVLRMAASQWAPTLFVAGSSGARVAARLTPSFEGEIYVSFSSSPPSGQFANFLERNGLTQTPRPPAAVAYGSAAVFTQALMTAGREVTREKLIAALEGLYRFQTGVTAPLTFGPNRRVGAAGAHIARYEKQQRRFVAAADWVEAP